jgi:diacylglycerol kinase (ATP)
MNRNRTFINLRLHAFRHAFRGWFYVLRTQRNAWVHGIITVLVVFISLWLQVPLHDWAILFITIGAVWTAEFINTALEAVVDLASPQHHPLAKVGKDVGAAAVLIAALNSILIGLLILGPPLYEKLRVIFCH